LSWEDSRTVEEWLSGQPHQSWKQEFEEQGVLVSFVLRGNFFISFKVLSIFK